MAKQFEEHFQDFGSNMGIVVSMSFPELSDSEADLVELPDAFIDLFFNKADKGIMSGESTLYHKGEDVKMTWKITAYESEDDEDEGEDE